MDSFLIILTIVLCVAAFVGTYIKMFNEFTPDGFMDYLLNGFLGFFASLLVFIFFALGNYFYWEHKKEKDEIAYCMKKIERGCKGWEYVITDKYSKMETQLISAGKCVVPITETKYYISYRINEIGTDDYESNTLNVSKSVYDYYVVGQTYTKMNTLVDDIDTTLVK